MIIKTRELKLLMIKRGFSGAGLAQAAKLTQAHIVNILRGRVSPRPSTAKKLCDALGCEFDDIFEIKAENS